MAIKNRNAAYEYYAPDGELFDDYHEQYAAQKENDAWWAGYYFGVLVSLSVFALIALVVGTIQWLN